METTREEIVTTEETTEEKVRAEAEVKAEVTIRKENTAEEALLDPVTVDFIIMQLKT